MRIAKKILNDYPPHGSDISLFDFVARAPAGLLRIIDFYNVWARELGRLEHILVVRYEEMRADPERALTRILRFIGTPGDAEAVREAVSFSAYDNMKKLEEKRVYWLSGKRMVPGDRKNPESYKVRRAKVGGYRDYFDDDQVRVIDDIVRRTLSPVFSYDHTTLEDASPARVAVTSESAGARASDR